MLVNGEVTYAALILLGTRKALGIWFFEAVGRSPRSLAYPILPPHGLAL